MVYSVTYRLWGNMKMTVVQFLLVWTPPPRLCRSVLLSNRSTPTYWHLGYLCWLVLCYTNNKDTLGSRLHIPAVGHLHSAEVLDSTVPLIQWTVVWKLVSQTVQCWALRIVTDYKKKKKKMSDWRKGTNKRRDTTWQFSFVLSQEAEYAFES